jgi:Spy/CpxP family protein refolding chaperone
MKRTLLFTLAMMMVLPLGLSAQTFPGRGMGQRNSERVKELRSKMLREKLMLNEDKAVAVENIFNTNQEEHKEIRSIMRDSRDELDKLLKIDSSDQAAYQSVLDTMAANRARMNEIRDEEMAALKGILTPKEQLQLLNEMNGMHKKMMNFRGGKGGFGVQDGAGMGNGKGMRNGSGKGLRDGTGNGLKNGAGNGLRDGTGRNNGGGMRDGTGNGMRDGTGPGCN